MQQQAGTAAEAASEALRLADKTVRTKHPYERDYVRCYWLLAWAALAQQQFDDAQRHLDAALRRCRAINLVEFEPKILLAHARLAAARARQNTSEVLKTSEVSAAFEFAEEAQTIAERSGYVLDLADIHNLLAQLALDSGDRTLAHQHAQQARNYAWCDGPPYAYQVALDEAERLLGETVVSFR